MAEKKVRLQIVTPTEKKVDEDADMVIMRCMTGDMGVLPGHEAYATVLDYGILRILEGGNERKIAVYSGLAMIQNDVLTVLTQEAEWPEETDLESAKADRERAEERLREKTDDLEIQSDQILLRRALVQIEISSYSFTAEEE